MDILRHIAPFILLIIWIALYPTSKVTYFLTNKTRFDYTSILVLGFVIPLFVYFILVAILT